MVGVVFICCTFVAKIKCHLYVYLFDSFNSFGMPTFGYHSVRSTDLWDANSEMIPSWIDTRPLAAPSTDIHQDCN